MTYNHTVNLYLQKQIENTQMKSRLFNSIYTGCAGVTELRIGGE